MFLINITFVCVVTGQRSLHVWILWKYALYIIMFDLSLHEAYLNITKQGLHSGLTSVHGVYYVLK